MSDLSFTLTRYKYEGQIPVLHSLPRFMETKEFNLHSSVDSRFLLTFILPEPFFSDFSNCDLIKLTEVCKLPNLSDIQLLLFIKNRKDKIRRTQVCIFVCVCVCIYACACMYVCTCAYVCGQCVCGKLGSVYMNAFVCRACVCICLCVFMW